VKSPNVLRSNRPWLVNWRMLGLQQTLDTETQHHSRINEPINSTTRSTRSSSLAQG